jgi:ribonuclease-3
MFRRLKANLFPTNRAFAATIKKLTGFAPINITLYEQALTHSSANISNGSGIKIDNERLEFLGDAVLDLIIADIVFRRYPNQDEGFLTELRSKIVNTSFLDQVSRKLGLVDLMQMDEKSRQQMSMNKNIHADVFEALIGALYLDRGYDAALSFIRTRIINVFVDFEEIIQTERNFKSKVLEWAQKHGKKVQFEEANTAETARKKQFAIQLIIDGKTVALGLDYSKKQAEQRAAQKYYESRLVGKS